MTVKSVAEMFGAGEVSTFLGLPSASIHALPVETRGVIFSVPGVTPYPSVGDYCASAPTAIRAAIAGYADNLTHVDFDSGDVLFDARPTVVDCGDLGFDASDFSANRRRVSEAVTAILAIGAVPIAIGGDDSLPLPIIHALSDLGPITILQIDAHIDWRDEVQGERLGLSSGMRRASELKHVEQIIQVGIRSIGSARGTDRDDALTWGAQIITGREVAKRGVGPALDAIAAGSNVMVCLDADGLDPSIMPAVLARAPGGLNYWQVIELLDGVAAKANLVGFELCELVPEADVDGQGALVAARILANVVRITAHEAKA